MLSVSIDEKQIARMADALGDVASRLPRHIATAINRTSSKVRTHAARQLKTELTAPVKVLKKSIRIKSKANQSKLSATIGLFSGYPIPLKYFRASQTKRNGVTYKTNPKYKAKSRVTDAFINKTFYGGNVLRRVGKDRGPLKVVYGPSPGDAFERGGVAAKAMKVAETELPKQMERRIREVLLRNSGTINLRKGN